MSANREDMLLRSDKRCFSWLVLAVAVLGLVALSSADEEKRAYSYVSEYKRLPVYNFGLGKRSADVKRSPAQSLYSFGLGKRDYDSSPAEDSDYEETMKDQYSKRVKQYAFGLGKRLPAAYSFGLGKRLPSAYSFGLGKRLPAAYSFGLGKRPDPKMYSFGLGKRDDDKRASGQKFSFGLGKRQPTDSSEDPTI